MRRVAVALALVGLAGLAVLAGGCSSGGAGQPTPSSAATAADPSAAATSAPATSAPGVPSPATSSTAGSTTPDRSASASATPSSAPTAARASAPPRAVTPTAPIPSVSYPAGSGPLVVLDPGHNGGNGSHTAQIDRLVPAGFGRMKPCNTTGTDTDAGYPEHSFNWDVAQRVKKILTAHGVRVIETRDNDTGVGPCVNVRAAIESTPGVVAAIAIHADGAPSGGHGFHVCYASRRPAGASAATMADNRKLSTDVHNALATGSGLVPSTYLGEDGYYPRSDEAGINLSTVPTTFLELGNMRNAGDAALQSSADGRQRIAAAVAAGILAYLSR